MAKLLKLRRGTTTQHSSFTGAEGEVTVDTDKESLVVHNGSTAGGFPIARADGTGVSNFTITGELDAATLDISGDADIDGTLEADAYTVDGTALNEYIADTVGAMVGSNTETGIAVTYEDSDNTLDFVLSAAQSTVTSLGTLTGLTVAGDVTFDNGTNAGKDIIWDESDNALEFTDDVKAVFGTDGDADIYHNDTDFYIDNDKGHIKIRSNVASDVGGDIHLMPHDDEEGIIIKHDGAVEIYHNNIRKLNTETAGIRVDGAGSADGIIALYANAGNTNNDLWRLESAVSGSNFYIKNGSSGSWETNLRCAGGGQVELYHDNIKTFSTGSQGISVYGPEAGDGIIYLYADEADDDDDKWRIMAAAGADFTIGSYSTGSWQNEVTITNGGNLTALGNVTAYSDSRLKTDVDTIENALDKVTKLRGVSFTRVDTDERGIGVIAQEIEEILPEVVQEGAYKSVAYGNIVGLLIEAIKELKAQVDEHKVTCEAEHNHGGN